MNEQNNTIEKKERTVTVPKVDIYETETTVTLIAEMPGVSEKNVDVDLQGNTLAIRGITSVTQPEGLTAQGNEYDPEKSYERQFTIGDTIDLNGIAASMKDGILKLTLPKLKELTPRKIVVTTNAE